MTISQYSLAAWRRLNLTVGFNPRSEGREQIPSRQRRLNRDDVDGSTVADATGANRLTHPWVETHG